MRQAITICVFILAALGVRAQPASTKGKEFWLTFMENYNTPKLTVHFSSTKNSVITITNPNTNYTKVLTVSANSLVSDTVSPAQCYNTVSGTVTNKGLKITATNEVTMYALNYLSASSDASVILPTQALGLNYRVLTYRGLNTYPSEFSIMASLDSTLVRITPWVTTSDNKPKKVPYTILLHKGQTYQVQGKNDSDLTGSLVEVQNCKPVAVFAGAKCTNIPNGCTACDHLYEQLFPLNNWGKEFIVVPTAGRSKDRFIVLADRANTSVTINGSTTTLSAAGDKYESDISAPTYILSDKPICVFIYAVGQTCGGGNGDPMMMWVTPVEQKISDIIFVSPASSVISNHYVNIVARTSTINSVKVNGVSIGSAASTVTSNPAYSYVKKTISAGTNTITSDSGFTAYAYGYGSAESYGYNVGSNIIDLNRFFTINGIINDNHSSSSNVLTVCKNTQVPFKGYSGSYTPMYWFWKFNNDSGGTTQNVSRTFTDTGLVKVSMITAWLSTNLCTASDTTIDTAIQYVQVIDPSLIIHTPDTIVCAGSSFQARITSSGYPIITWMTGTSDMSCVQCAEPIITPTKSQWYKVRLGASIGCILTDSFYVHLKDSVKMTVSNDTLICRGAKAKIKASLLNKDSIISYTYKLYRNNTFLMQDTVPSFEVYPDSNSTYYIHIHNSCYNAVSPPVKVYLRPALKLQFVDSQLVCSTAPNNLLFKGTGGDSSYSAWFMENGNLVDSVHNMNINVNYSFTVKPKVGSAYKMILKDACTIINDTQIVHFKFRQPNSFTHTPDTMACISQSMKLRVTASGGDSSYKFYLFKNNVLSDSISSAVIGNNYYFNVSQTANTVYKVVLNDGCMPNDTQIINVSVRNALNDQITILPNICEGILTQISVKASGGDSSYTFYLLDSTSLVDSIRNAVPNQTYQFSAHPTFKTKYFVVLNDGCTVKSDTQALVYSFRPPIGFTHSRDTMICKGQSARLYVKPFGGDSTFKVWMLVNNIVKDSIENINFGGVGLFTVWPDTGTSYKFVLSDGCTYLNDTQSVMVKVRQPLSMSVSNTSMICRGQSVSMTAAPAGGDSSYTLYLLNNGMAIDSVNATYGNSYNFVKIPALNTSYQFTMKDGCTLKNDSQSLPFIFRDALSFTHTGDTMACISQNMKLHVKPYGGDSSYTFYLLKNNVLTDSISNAVMGNGYYFNVSQTANTTYKLVLRDGCTIANDTQTIHVSVRNALSDQVSILPNICEGILTQISVKANGGDSSYTFYLLDSTSLVDSIRNAVPNQTYQFSAHPTFKTKYFVVLKDGCTVKSDTQALVYSFRPPIGFTHSRDTMICRGQSARLYVKPFGGDSTFKVWMLVNNVLKDSIENINFGGVGLFTVWPDTGTSYKFVLSDGCTYLNDTQLVRVNVRQPLSMSVSNTSMICRGQSVSMTATPAGGDSSYTLYLLNNGMAIDSVNSTYGNSYNFVKTPALNASYQFAMKDGCTLKNDSQSLPFIFRDALSITQIPAGPICIGQTYQAGFSASGGDSTYSCYVLKDNVLIDSLEGVVTGSVYSFPLSPVVTSTYRLLVKDFCTLKNDTQFLTIKVRDKLDMMVSKDTIICRGQETPLMVSPIGGDSLYSIYLYEGAVLVDSALHVSIGNSHKFKVHPLVLTQYRIILNDFCTSLHDTALVNIDVYPQLKVKAGISEAVVCDGRPVTLTATASGGAINSTFTYVWNHGAGNGKVVSTVPPGNTTYTVQADDGCSTSAFDSVDVTIEPVPKASFISMDTAGCEPYMVRFQNQSISLNHVTYFWTFGDGASDTLKNPATHTYAEAGSYPVFLRLVSDFGCADSLSRPAYIRVFDNPEIVLNAEPGKVKLDSGLINFTAHLKYSDAYQVDFGDGNGIYNQSPSTVKFNYTYRDTGYFVIRLSARNNHGCTSEMTDTIFVEDVFTMEVPTSFSPNNDGLNDYFKPVSTFSRKYHMTIYDRWGTLLYSEYCNGQWDDCRGWDGKFKNVLVPDGVYIYMVAFDEENDRNHYKNGTIVVLH